MRSYWFAVVVLLVLGLMAGLYGQPSVTGQFVANLPPMWDYPADDFFVDGPFELDLADAFFDPDGRPLSFSVRGSESVAVGLKGSVLVAEVFDDGYVWITVSDGTYQVVHNIRLRI